MIVNHIEIYVDDAYKASAELSEHYGLAVVAEAETAEYLSIALRLEQITVILTQGLVDGHPASSYVHSHGDGVADIAVRVTDVAQTVRTAIDAGARLVQEPHTPAGFEGWTIARIEGFGDVCHTLISPPAPEPEGWLPPPFTTRPTTSGSHTLADGTGLGRMDHFAVCLESGTLDSTVAFYQAAFGMRMVFEERIVVGPQAMLSQVVQGGDLILTLIEPDATTAPGQISEFLRSHGGPGVQHVALTTDDIAHTVDQLRGNGVEFLSTPDAYYTGLADRFQVNTHAVEVLQALSILVDQDHDGQLFQIFARSTHPRNTLFFEVIQRAGARHFGSGNIKALYEAVERESVRTRVLS